jgi:hypothetical protein
VLLLLLLLLLPLLVLPQRRRHVDQPVLPEVCRRQRLRRLLNARRRKLQALRCGGGLDRGKEPGAAGEGVLQTQQELPVVAPLRERGRRGLGAP